MNSSYIKIFQNFFMVLEFMELKYHGKLNFGKIEFQKNGKLLNISQIIVDCIIFSKKMVFGHFGRKGGKGYFFSMFSVFENRCVVF